MRIRLIALLSFTALVAIAGAFAHSARHHAPRANFAALRLHKHHFVRAHQVSFAALPTEQIFDSDLDTSAHASADFSHCALAPNASRAPLKLKQPVYASSRTFDASVQLLL